MKRGTLNYWIDVILGISFLAVSITGIIKLKSVMDYFGLEWRSRIIQILSKIHDWSGIIMIIFVLIHLFLHRKWIVVKTKEIFGSKKDKK